MSPLLRPDWVLFPWLLAGLLGVVIGLLCFGHSEDLQKTYLSSFSLEFCIPHGTVLDLFFQEGGF